MNNENRINKTISIEGMQCGHCKAAVEEALKSINGVKFAEVNLENKSATVELEEEVETKILKQAIEEQGFKVISID